MDFGAMLAGLKPMFGGANAAPAGPTAPETGAPPALGFLSNPQPNSPMQPVAPAVPAAGMAPSNPAMSLVSMAGMLAGALTPKDSWQSRVGAAATQGAQTNILANAQLKRDADHQKFLSEALKYYPASVVQGLAQHSVGNTGVFSPEGGIGNPFAPPAPAIGGGNK